MILQPDALQQLHALGHGVVMLAAEHLLLREAEVVDDPQMREQLEMLKSNETLPDEQATSIIDGERWTGWLRSALTQLNERESRIIKARRLTEDGATLEELGVELGISKERVRQIETRALEKLKFALTTRVPAASRYEMAY